MIYFAEIWRPWDRPVGAHRRTHMTRPDRAAAYGCRRPRPSSLSAAAASRDYVLPSPDFSLTHPEESPRGSPLAPRSDEGTPSAIRGLLVFRPVLHRKITITGMRSLLVLHMGIPLHLPDRWKQVLATPRLAGMLESFLRLFDAQPLSSNIYGLYTVSCAFHAALRRLSRHGARPAQGCTSACDPRYDRPHGDPEAQFSCAALPHRGQWLPKPNI